MATFTPQMAKDAANGGGGGSFVFVYDRREGNNPEIRVPTKGVQTFEEFRSRVVQFVDLNGCGDFVITTTNREEINDDSTWEQVVHGDTLYILENVDQELPAQAQERVSYLPHYDTIVKGGMYEYYASEGQNPLPYAFAELIDNALAATVDNIGARNIEIRLIFDDINPSRSCIVVVDNGKGMTSHQLNNWAIYRLSKFNRKEFKKKRDDLEEDTLGRMFPMLQAAPRSLNSDISYFGVGGKQAIFFVGSSTRMISKPKGSKDVHELTISKDEFERKEKNHESIYAGYIRNRKPGDTSHLPSDDEVLKMLYAEEIGKPSFTAVVINGINPVHIPYLKANVKEWTRQLAHIYHYYIHGPAGNLEGSRDPYNRPASPFLNIDIQIKLMYRGRHDTPNKCINLRDIDDDMQTQYIRTAASSFEFKAIVEGTGIVEGVLRYHPFLYDKETFPSDANDPRADPDPDEDHEYAISDNRPARGRRSIFECYWNGRLIPYTTVEEFDWCAVPKKSKVIPFECYNRISGVLWTNDKFQVSTNKLTFTDLEMKLRDKNTAYTRITGKTEKRTAIDKEFNHWLKECHQHCDKQVKFSVFGGTISRPELPKNRQNPWSVYGQIEWDGKVFKKGQMVRIAKVVPIVFGTVKRFLLYGDHEGDVFATGGDIEVSQEPKSLYDEVKTFHLSKLDRAINQPQIRKLLDEEEARLPDQLLLTWPSGDEVDTGEKRPAGKTIGDIKVEIQNRKGELISKLPGSNAQKKLLVELRVIWHSPNGDEVIVSHISQHGKTWPYWFRKMENIKHLGGHTLKLQVILNESGAKTFAGKDLPSHKIKFTVTEAEAEKFTVGLLDGPFRMGCPFQIPLEFQDEFGNATKPSDDIIPDLEANGLELKYGETEVKGNSLIIQDIVALGTVPSSAGKNFSLLVRVPGLEADTQTLKIRMLPGPPHALHITPEDEVVDIENGTPFRFGVEVRDEAGNPTTQSRLVVVCKFSGAVGLPPAYNLDCSTTGQGTLTGHAINLKNIKGDEQIITARIEVPNVKAINGVEKKMKVIPSTRASHMEVSYKNEDDEEIAISNGQEIFGEAGEYIKDISFKITDEAGREIDIEETWANKVKVNWTPKVSKDMIEIGKLPDIKVPNLVSDSKYCHVSLSDGSGLQFAFTVKSVPGKPSQLKCRCSGSNEVRMGETLQTDLLIMVHDKHGNEMKRLDKERGVLRDLSITGEGLVTHETVRALGQTSGFNIHGVKFESGSLGSREVCINWRGLTDYVRLQVIAGPPSKLTIPDWDLNQPITIYNENKFERSLMVQLCDESGNPTSESNVRIQMAKDTGIKLIPPTQPLKTDKRGQADFGILTVSGKRGVYELQPKAFMGRTTISGPKVKVSIQADGTKPINVVVEYDKNASYTVGESLPDFTVKVIGEDEDIMSTAKPSCISMKLWRAEGLQARPPNSAISFKPDTKKKKVPTATLR